MTRTYGSDSDESDSDDTPTKYPVRDERYGTREAIESLAVCLVCPPSDSDDTPAKYPCPRHIPHLQRVVSLSLSLSPSLPLSLSLPPPLSLSLPPSLPPSLSLSMAAFQGCRAKWARRGCVRDKGGWAPSDYDEGFRRRVMTKGYDERLRRRVMKGYVVTKGYDEGAIGHRGCRAARAKGDTAAGPSHQRRADTRRPGPARRR